MGLIFIDGFDSYDTIAKLDTKWDSRNGTSQTIVGGRHGGNALHLEGTGNRVGKTFPYNLTDFVVGGYLRIHNRGGGYPIIQFYNDSLHMFNIHDWSGDTLQVEIGSAQWKHLHSPFRYDPGEWFHFEMKWSIKNSVNEGDCTFRINNQEVFRLPAGTDSAPQVSGGEYIKTMHLGSTIGYVYSSDHDWDYIYVIDQNDGVEPSGYLGMSNIDLLMPNAAGTTNAFTNSAAGAANTNYTYVDEVPPDDDTTYIYSTGSSITDTYNAVDASGVKTVHAVSVFSHVKSDDGSDITHQVVRTGGTDYVAASGNHLSTSYAYKQSFWGVNPNTGSSWTPTEIDALEIGVQKE